jgi:hypothetical protein
MHRQIRRALKAAILVGVLTPLARRRVPIPPAAVATAAFSAPLGVVLLAGPSRRRHVAFCALYMWAHLTLYELPNEDPEVLARRVRVRYPILADRMLGAGVLPTLRLQRLLSSGSGTTRLDAVLVWAHWVWFLVPNGTLAYVLWRRPDLFARATARIYATFELGAIVYWLLPTAPPWYAALNNQPGAGQVRRLMSEYGEELWGDRWPALYAALGGNPLAAMPSLHVATAAMAARVMGDVGTAEAMALSAYSGLLAFALVYLGEHYVVDIAAGLALTAAVQRLERRYGRAAARAARLVNGLARRLQA